MHVISDNGNWKLKSTVGMEKIYKMQLDGELIFLNILSFRMYNKKDDNPEWCKSYNKMEGMQ